MKSNEGNTRQIIERVNWCEVKQGKQGDEFMRKIFHQEETGCEFCFVLTVMCNISKINFYKIDQTLNDF